MGQVKITVDEWLAELARLSALNGKGETAKELARRAGLSERVMLLRLRQARDMGWLRVEQRTDVRIDGRPQKVPVYRIERPRSQKGSNRTQLGNGQRK